MNNRTVNIMNQAILYEHSIQLLKGLRKSTGLIFSPVYIGRQKYFVSQKQATEIKEVVKQWSVMAARLMLSDASIQNSPSKPDKMDYQEFNNNLEVISSFILEQALDSFHIVTEEDFINKVKELKSQIEMNDETHFLRTLHSGITNHKKDNKYIFKIKSDLIKIAAFILESTEKYNWLILNNNKLHDHIVEALTPNNVALAKNILGVNDEKDSNNDYR